MEAKDDKLFEEEASFLSMTRPLEDTHEPTEDMAVKVDAIYSFMKLKNIQHHCLRIKAISNVNQSISYQRVPRFKGQCK